MMRLIFAIATILVGTTYQAAALTVAGAQACADKLLAAYNDRVYPASMMATESITRRTFGASFKAMTSAQQAEAHKATKVVLKESFEKPTGKYMYRDLVVSTVKVTDSGFTIRGDVYITSPKYTGEASFLALVQPGCRVEQVRIGDIYALDSALRAELSQEAHWREILD